LSQRLFKVTANFNAFQSNSVVELADLEHGVQGVARVRPHHQRGVGAAGHDQVAQVLAPDALAGVVNVVAVADDGHGHVGELLHDVLEGVPLVVLAPRCDGAGRREEGKKNLIQIK